MDSSSPADSEEVTRKFIEFRPLIGEHLAEPFRLVFLGGRNVCILNSQDRLVGCSVDHDKEKIVMDFYNITCDVVNSERFCDIFGQKSLHFQYIVYSVDKVISESGQELCKICLAVDTREISNSGIKFIFTSILVKINKHLLLKGVENLVSCNNEVNNQHILSHPAALKMKS